MEQLKLRKEKRAKINNRKKKWMLWSYVHEVFGRLYKKRK